MERKNSKGQTGLRKKKRLLLLKLQKPRKEDLGEMVEVETVSGVAVNADCGVVDDRDLYCAMRQRREARGEAAERRNDARRSGWRKRNGFRFLTAFEDEKERLEPGLAWRTMCNSDLRFCRNGLRSQAGLAHICC